MSHFELLVINLILYSHFCSSLFEPSEPLIGLRCQVLHNQSCLSSVVSTDQRTWWHFETHLVECCLLL